MGWMESFAKEEQERKARESIKQIQDEYAEELELEMAMEDYFEKKHNGLRK